MRIKISESLKEGIKEGLRVALFAGVSAGVSYGLDRLAVLDQEVIWVVLGIIFLKIVDKTIHKIGKDGDRPALVKGLSRF